jgi:hypothetical protein
MTKDHHQREKEEEFLRYYHSFFDVKSVTGLGLQRNNKFKEQERKFM